MRQRLVYRHGMSKLTTAIALASVVACSSNNSGTVADAPSGGRPADAAIDAAAAARDAPGSGSGSGSGSGTGSATNFACAGNTTPPTVPSTLTVTGTANALNTSLTSLLAMQFTTPYVGPVELCSDEPCTGANLLGSATTDATGAYSFTVSTNSAPVPAYVEIAAFGSGSAATLETLSFMGTPLVQDTAMQALILAPQSAIAAVAANAGGTCTTGPGLGFVAYKAVDCSSKTITDTANVHATLMQNAAAVGDPPIDIYQTIITVLASAGLSSYDQMAAPLQGIFITCGVPAGETTLGVSYAGSGNVDFLPVTFRAIGSAATEVTAQPGY
jgi:hypothetical protein